MATGDYGVSITGIRAASAGVPASPCEQRIPLASAGASTDPPPPSPNHVSTTLCAAAQSVYRGLASRDPRVVRMETAKRDTGRLSGLAAFIGDRWGRMRHRRRPLAFSIPGSMVDA